MMLEKTIQSNQYNIFMPGIKFVHTADLHLDTPFKGLSNVNTELASRLKDATLKSFQRIINLCISEKVDFLLIAGDIFDSEAKSLSAQLRFVDELKRLSQSGIPSYIITGNHDPLISWMNELEMPSMVHRFGSVNVESVTLMRDNQPLADIYGVSFENKSVDWNLASTFMKKTSQAPFSVAMMHGTISSATSHHPYAPFSIDDIKGKGFDYWALGHVHKRQVVSSSSPAVVYPGNPQGRDFGETGQRGCYLVEINFQQAPGIRFVPTQQIRFEELVIDLSNTHKINILPEVILKAMQGIQVNNDKSSLILRLNLVGRTPLHIHLHKPGEVEQLTDLLNEGQLQREYFQWIDRISINTMPDIDLMELKKGNDFTAEILKAVEYIEVNLEKLDEKLFEIESEFNSQAAKRELKELSPAEKKEILAKAQWMIIDQLIKE
jgi:DNA repair protein SbcD/Mre11